MRHKWIHIYMSFHMISFFPLPSLDLLSDFLHYFQNMDFSKQQEICNRIWTYLFDCFLNCFVVVVVINCTAVHGKITEMRIKPDIKVFWLPRLINLSDSSDPSFPWNLYSSSGHIMDYTQKLLFKTVVWCVVPKNKTHTHRLLLFSLIDIFWEILRM